MAIGKRIPNVEYMCRWCGTRITKLSASGRPQPRNFPRRPKNRMGRPQPHSWVINRKF